MSATYGYKTKEAANAAAARFRRQGFKVTVSNTKQGGKYQVRTEATRTSGRKRR